MCRPLRLYSFCLAERLGKSLKEVLMMESDELSEWMAYDLTRDEAWSKKYKQQEELRKSQSVSAKEKVSQFRLLLGTK